MTIYSYFNAVLLLYIGAKVYMVNIATNATLVNSVRKRKA